MFRRTATSGCRVAAAVALLVAALAGPAFAHPQKTYMECDNAHSPDYPFLVAHPSGCDVGLAQSIYQTLPVNGRSFTAFALRRLHWSHWSRHEATAHGLACDVRSNGSAVHGTCDHVEVDVYAPRKVGPAGFLPIYRLTRVLHRRTHREAYRYGYWYQTGTDY